MNAMLKRMISLLLCFVLVAGYLPVGAFAEETGETVAADATAATGEPSVVETTGETVVETTEETQPEKPGKPAEEKKPGKDEKPAKPEKPGKHEKPEQETTPVTETTVPVTEETVPETTEATVPATTEATVPAVIAVTGITLDQTALEVGVGELPMTLTATVQPEDATDKTVTWTSSEPGVASVEDGVLTFGYMGKATITATAGEVSASCVVTVGEGEWDTYEGEPVVVIAGSDYQQSGSAAPKTNTQNILKAIRKNYATANGFIFGGDYSQTLNNNSSTNSGIEELRKVVEDVYGTDLNEVFVQGNHDAAVSSLTSTGAHDTDYYGVFSINEDDFSSSYGGNSVASTSMLNALESYLNEKVNTGYSKPVFVTTHLPLHATSRGDNNSATKIFDLLNSAGASGLNIIFLFGHNHSAGYDAYLGNGAIYLPKGSSIRVAGGSTSTLNFTYMNNGYVGYVSGSACTHLTMTTFEISDTEVIVKRYDANGEHTCGSTADVLKAAGVASGSYAADATVVKSGATITLTTPTGGSGDSGDDNTGSGDNSGTTGGSGYTYELVTSIEAGEKYVIVGNDHPVALMDNSGSIGSESVTIDGTTLTSYVALTEWTISGTSGGTIVSDQSNGLSYSSSSWNLSGDSDNTFNIGTGSSNFSMQVQRSNSNSNKYYFYYDGLAWAKDSSNTQYVRLYKLNGTGSSGGSTVTPSGGDWVTISSGVGGTIYKLDTDGVTTGKDYLIVSTGSNGTAQALRNNNGSVSSAEVTISNRQIVTDAADIVWTYDSSQYLSNSSYFFYLSYNNENDFLSTSEKRSVAITSNNAGEGAYTVKRDRYNYYLNYNNGSWTNGSSADDIYFFVKSRTEAAGDAEYAKLDGDLTYTVSRGASNDEALVAVKAGINVLTSASADGANPITQEDGNTDIKWELASNYDGNTPGEYAVTISYKGVTLGTAKVVVPDVGIEANDVLYYIDENLTAPIGANVTAGTPQNGNYTYEVVEGGNTIVESIADDGIISFTGAEGTAQVKITYTYGEGENSVTLEKIINVTAKAPYYSVELCDPVTVDGTTTYEPITAPIALKGVQTGNTYSLWAVVKEYNAEHPDGHDLGDVEDNSLMWSVSDTSIARIDSTTGILTFTGNSYGTIDVTVYYLDEGGKPACGDTVTVSASQSQYVVPGDGTNDFPEYPEQGAIRIDKTAVAQGNFSKSGIAKVELSMTGVPYGSSTPTDVVIMVDMTTSMYHYDYVDDADAAIKNMLEALVYDTENDKYDPNIYVQVWSFKSDDDGENVAFTQNLSRRNITNKELLKAAQDAIAFNTDGNDGSGTCYDEGTKKMYEIVNNCTTENVVAVFASDGGPSRYAYLNDEGSSSEISGSNANLNDGDWFNEDGSVTNRYRTEYYTYLLKTKQNPVPVYTVGIGIDDNTNEAWILEHMSSEYDATGKTVSTAPANATTDYFALADINTTPDVLSTVFTGIAASIREAATDVVVEDKIDSHYTANFSLPSGVTADEAGMSDFYIQVLGYELDEHNDRKANPTVLEKILFKSDGTIAHTINSTTCSENCSHVTKTGGVVTGISGHYFKYAVKDDEEFLTWEAEKLDRTELALEYFVYLDNSAGEVAAAEQVEPGTYPTNEYATITYTNFNGKECQRYFPVPTMTWMGAKVTYTFYLVNAAGQPVNRAGKVIPFAEAIYVTDPVTYDVTWNEDKGIERLSADYLADGLVPEVYELYDEEAYYEIRVYQTEGVDTENVVNYNYFVIKGANEKLIDSAMDTDTVLDNSTTKVYNTKAGTKYDEYGVYSQKDVGTVLNTAYVGADGTEKAGTVTTTVKTTDIDYANTTVAFAVVWKPELNPDTVVIDYGLDVVIDVTTNDALASGVTGVSNTAPTAEINKGTYENSAMGTSANYMLGEDILGTAKVENLTSVRFSLNKANGMKFTEPAKFYYESACNYYTYDNNDDRILNTTHMYSSVTVIPATTIYYEDEFVDLTSESKKSDGNWTEDESPAWTTEGSKVNATQAQDRPGASQISAAIDADNNYGYDVAYSSMSQYSLGSAAKVNVSSGHRAKATFEFYGTGFDVISLTSNKTGTIVVSAYPWDADTNAYATEAEQSYVVDTYYGYTRNDAGEWVVDKSTADNSLYQVPVMKISDLPYGKYKAEIVAAYDTMFDHAQYDGANYDFYLDAIRIYDPTGNENDVSNNAYVADGEGWPTYFEVRNKIIDANTFGSVEIDPVNGIVFIDGVSENKSVSDYTSYGPNNETYLAGGQAIAFDLKATAAENTAVAKVQLAVKTVGDSASIKVYSADGVTALDKEITTATDMYYDITALNGKTVVIMNDGMEGILSITNVKVTYTAAQNVPEPAGGLFMLRRSSVDAALATMNVEEEVPETTVPETTEPEETEPAEPDNSDLKAAVEAAKKLKEKDYTKESYKAVKTARKAAEKVLKDKNATQAEINDALAELNEAMEALEAAASKAKPGKKKR